MSEAKEISPIEQPESATIAAKDRDDSVASEMDGRDSRIAELEKAPMLDPEKGRVEKSDTSSPETPAAAKKEEKNKAADAAAFAFCFVGLQVSYLTWGFVQEKVMTNAYKLYYKTRVNASTESIRRSKKLVLNCIHPVSILII